MSGMEHERILWDDENFYLIISVLNVSLYLSKGIHLYNRVIHFTSILKISV